MTYHIPGKTFLVGEYSALVSGSVLGLGTSPGFDVQYNSKSEFKFAFSLQSPAGIQWQKDTTVSFQFEDQIKVGGFGKSTAEYLTVLIPSLEKKSNDKYEDIFLEIRNNYIHDSEISGARVSGLDLAIQCYGAVTYFDAKTATCKALNWKLPSLEFILVSTGIKVKTHEHLQNIDLKKISHFPSISNAVIDFYLQGQTLSFIQGLNEWTKFLTSENLVHDHSVQLQSTLLKNSDILCAKPCGAMGADVILVLCELEKSQSVQHKILELGLTVISTTKDLAAGIFQQISNSQLGLYVG